MTVREVINKTDEFFPNVLPFNTKALWLKELDSRVYREFLMNFSDNENEYRDEEYTASTVLLIPDAFSEVYIRYLTMQQDILNGDTVRYQNSALLFNSSYLAFMNFHNRTHSIVNKHINVD